MHLGTTYFRLRPNFDYRKHLRGLARTRSGAKTSLRTEAIKQTALLGEIPAWVTGCVDGPSAFRSIQFSPSESQAARARLTIRSQLLQDRIVIVVLWLKDSIAGPDWKHRRDKTLGPDSLELARIGRTVASARHHFRSCTRPRFTWAGQAFRLGIRA